MLKERTNPDKEKLFYKEKFFNKEKFIRNKKNSLIMKTFLKIKILLNKNFFFLIYIMLNKYIK